METLFLSAEKQKPTIENYMNNQELFYRLALGKVNGIGPIKYKKLISLFDSAEQIFGLNAKILKRSGLLSEANIEAIRNFRDFADVENELKFVASEAIKIFFFDEVDYPEKLKNCVDSPAILFQKGPVDLNNTRVLSVIGTRSFTEYGRRVCEDLVEQLKPYNVVIVSGLAYGIDVIAHRACLKNQIPTVGVLAHGLAMMYPPGHSTVAREMVQSGGLLSEYFSSAKLEKGNFPSRNRIVAGLSDATIVVETDLKGGSMITAEIAFSYNREVFCFPGRSIDSKSAGCNFLIRKLKAQLITGADDLAKELGWKQSTKPKVVQKELFIEMTENEKIIMQVLSSTPQIHIDELLQLSNLSNSQIAGAMLNLEMQNIIQVMPGKMISISRG